MTVQIPITEPMTGPAIHVGFRGAAVPDCVGFGADEAVSFAASAAEAEARDADSEDGLVGEQRWMEGETDRLTREHNSTRPSSRLTESSSTMYCRQMQSSKLVYLHMIHPWASKSEGS